MNSCIYIANKTGGRLANQLYFVLQAYCISQRLNVSCKYTQTTSIAAQTDLSQYVDFFGIQKYYIKNANPTQYLQLHRYYQDINDDFSYDELTSFIQETILQSGFFKSFSFDRDFNITAAIHIRNGDYLSLPIHNCFNRTKYIEKALSLLPKRIKHIDVYSDDNNLNKLAYDSIFSSFGFTVSYINNFDVISDLKNLSFYKTKILWNSTFSYWSTFISDCRYENDYMNKLLTICPTKFTTNIKANTHCKKEWTLII